MKNNIKTKISERGSICKLKNTCMIPIHTSEGHKMVDKPLQNAKKTRVQHYKRLRRTQASTKQ